MKKLIEYINLKEKYEPRYTYISEDKQGTVYGDLLYLEVTYGL